MCVLGRWMPERKTQKNETEWGHFILCSAKKSGPVDARHFLSHRGDQDKCGRRGKSDYFMGLGGDAVRGRKMVPLNPNMFPSNEGILFVA